MPNGVVREIPVEEGVIMPWFGEEGLGIQYKLPQKIEELIPEFIIEIP